MAVFVLGRRKKPLMPCSEKRARILLERGRARVHRMVPFTIRLVDRLQADSVLQPVRLKLDPGSRTTGIALVREKETGNASTGGTVRTLRIRMLLELQQRGQAIRDALTRRGAFRRRRRGNLRHRPARFDSRTRKAGSLPPSLQHRVDTVMAWVRRLMRLASVTALSQERVRFDLQKMRHPEISGTEYQQGTLAGYGVREYLLEKWGRECACCGAENVPLEIDHIHPRSRGGSDSVSSLAIACHSCNQRKGNSPLEQFLAKHPERIRKIRTQAKAPLKDAAAVNSTRWALFERLKATNLPVEAACVGHADAMNKSWQQPVPGIKATGRGSYQRTRLTRHGFPRGYLTRSKSVFGFQTGDLVKAIVTTGRKAGEYLGRAAIRASGRFSIQTRNGLVQGIHHRFCTRIQRADGYGYMWTKIASDQGDAGLGQASPAALSLPGRNAGVSRATG